MDKSLIDSPKTKQTDRCIIVMQIQNSY